MLHHPTVERLHELRLFGMPAALADQQSPNSINQLGFEERLGLLVEREASERQSRLFLRRGCAAQSGAFLTRYRKTSTTASPVDSTVLYSPDCSLANGYGRTKT